MNRRNFLANSVVAGISLTALSAGAQDAPLPGNADRELLLATEIAKNHGHALELSMVEVVDALRKSIQGEVIAFDIQGSSGHGHSLVLNELELLDLIKVGTVEVLSSKDAGHSHGVTITLQIS